MTFALFLRAPKVGGAHVEFRIDKMRRRGGNIAAVQRLLVQTFHHGIVVPGGLAEAGKGICAGR